MRKILTLCIVHQHPKVLLGMKKRGFGAGRWNGFGGKVGEGEAIEEAARRELREEAGIDARALTRAGVLEFSWDGKPEVLEVHLFRATEFSGEPQEFDIVILKLIYRVWINGLQKTKAQSSINLS